MRKPVIAVVAIVVVAAGGYTAAWFKKAADFKASYIESVANLNAKTKPMLKTGELISYESVNVSGFPFAMKLSISKPSVRLPIVELTRLITKKYNLIMNLPDAYDWVEEISYADGISITSDIVGSTFEIVVSGDRHQKALFNEQTKASVNYTTDTPVVCHLKTKPNGFLVMYPVFHDAESFFNAFQSMDCSTSGMTAKDESTGAVISSMDKMTLSVANIHSGINRASSFTFESSGGTYTAAFDTIRDTYINLYFGAVGKPVITPSYSLAEFGPISVNMNIAYNGPDTLNSLGEKDTNLHFDVNAFDVKSNLFTIENQVHFNLQPQGEIRAGSLYIKSKSNVSERYDEIIRAQTEKTITQLANPEGKTGKELEIATNVSKLGDAKTMVETLFPRFHSLGDMLFELNGEASGPSNAAGFMANGSGKLTALNILTAPYGIKAAGEASSKDKHPSANFTLNCLNCDQMITDIGNYMIRFASYMSAVSPDKKTTVLPVAYFNGFKVFVHDIALNGTDPNAKDLSINFVVKDNGEALISGKQVMQVMQSYMTNVASQLPKEPPPSIPPEHMPSVLQPR